MIKDAVKINNGEMKRCRECEGKGWVDDPDDECLNCDGEGWFDADDQ